MTIKFTVVKKYTFLKPKYISVYLLSLNNVKLLMYLNDDNGISCYIKELAGKRYEPLSKKEERTLLKKYKETKDVRIRNKIADSNLRFAFAEANNWVGNGLSTMELISEANEGLMESIERFDTSYDNRLGAYAKWWINLKIRDSIKNRKKIEEREVDEALGLNREYDDENEESIGTNVPVNYDIPLSFIYEEEDVQKNDSDYIDRVMASLTEREQDMLNRYFGRGYDRSYTLVEIGNIYGVSKPRVTQIIEVALKKIRVNAIMEAEFHDE